MTRKADDEFRKMQDAERMVALVAQMRQYSERQENMIKRATQLQNEFLYLMNASAHEITAAAGLGNEAMAIWTRLTEQRKPKKKPAINRKRHGHK